MFKVFVNKDQSVFSAVVYSLGKANPTHQLKAIEKELRKNRIKEGFVLFDFSTCIPNQTNRYLEIKMNEGVLDTKSLRTIPTLEFHKIQRVNRHYLNDPTLPKNQPKEPFWKKHLFF